MSFSRGSRLLPLVELLNYTRLATLPTTCEPSPLARRILQPFERGSEVVRCDSVAALNREHPIHRLFRGLLTINSAADSAANLVDTSSRGYRRV